jgi:hypothetical protein
MSTFKSKYNNKYGFPKNESHSVEDISKTSGIKKSILQDVYDRGIGAWKSNPTSVRSKSGDKKDSGFPLSKRMTKERWAYGRVYGFVMKNPKQVGEGKPDNDLFKKL